jgi:hypothetical protein
MESINGCCIKCTLSLLFSSFFLAFFFSRTNKKMMQEDTIMSSASTSGGGGEEKVAMSDSTSGSNMDRTTSASTSGEMFSTNKPSISRSTAATATRNTVWTLGVDHSNHVDFYDVVAIFDSAKSGLRFLKRW